MRPGPGGQVVLWRAAALARRLFWRLRDALRRPSCTPLPALPPRRGTAGGRALRVGFVVCEPAKWSLGPLLAHLHADPDFDCGFYCTLSDVGLRQSRAGRRAAHAAARAFFAAQGPVWGELYHPASDRMQPVARIDCDVLFIQQPWGMQDLPRRLAGRVRCAYVHYGFPVIRNDRMQFGLPDFHPFLWRHFVPSSLHREAILAAAGPASAAAAAARVRVAGYPKLDVFHTPPPARTAVPAWPRAAEGARRRVLLAPHHAFGPGSLGLATFAWSGPAMLDLARAHGAVDFLLRPHPNMQHVMTKSTLNRRYAAFLADWQALPNAALFTEGGYLDVFRTSDALITDSGAFLAEYLPTGKPLIRLVQPGSAALNAVGAALEAGFYCVPDQATLATVFARVVLAGDDPLAGVRAGKAALVLPEGRPSSAVLADHLRESLRACP